MNKEHIKFGMPLLVMFASLIAGWTTFENRLEAADLKIKALEMDSSKLEAIQFELRLINAKREELDKQRVKEIAEIKFLIQGISQQLK